ncbi:methyl-accepting chemotaxis protein [Halobaculum magnesiiphilum]|uniref:Methyl-accepting chemotaxis protein n=1 Tax=Halobaculum magnesiiphilum TaxID=1017351 RepID=A0A8T8WEM8_9EURY|nr:methyl-accepting chemotaxis protein [Halobaculum magnesiiphilum]QZP38322.1 methyl-accepting chemotaxis protein [Halobaculum magnesiiphilum]
MSRIPDVLRRTYLRKFTALTLATLLIVTGAGVVLQGQVAAQLTDRTHDDLTANAETTASEVSIWIDNNERTVRLVSQQLKADAGDADAVKTTIELEHRKLPDSVVALHYVNKDSMRVERSTSDDAVGSSLDHVRWESGASDLAAIPPTGSVLSKTYEHEGTHRIAFASWVPGTANAVVMTVDASAVAGGTTVDSDGNLRVVDSEDAAIHLASDPAALTETFAGGVDSHAIAEGVEGAGAHDMADSGTVMAYAPVEGTDWVVVRSVPQSVAYGLVTQVQTALGAVIGLAALGFLLIGVTMGRSTSRTLRDLAARAEALAAGDTDGAAGDADDRIDEVGAVQGSFEEVRRYLATATAQATVVADGEFDAPVLDRDVPGDLGDALAEMREDLRSLIAEMEATNEALADAAESYGETMERAAEGDLTARMDADVDDESMARIATEFNEMMDELSATVGEVDRVAAAVASASAEADAGVAEAERAAGEVADSTDEIAAGVDEQVSHLQEVTGEMSDLSAAVEEVAATADQVADVSDEAAERGERGAALADDAVAEMEAIEDQTETTAEVVRGLESEVTAIGDIVDLIDDIAEQTNTLALNASIEAARAGAEGDGFAVVAEEVKTLATETREATGRIADRIEAVQSSTADAVDDIEETTERVEEGAETIEAGLGALGDVVEAVEEANDGVQSISTAADDQAASAEEVVAMADEVASVSEEAAAEAESVSAAAAEQSASLNQVSGEVERLAERAADLRELAGSFETAAEATAEGGVEPRAGDDAVDGPDGVEFDEGSAVADGGETNGTSGETNGTSGDANGTERDGR